MKLHTEAEGKADYIRRLSVVIRIAATLDE